MRRFRIPAAGAFILLRPEVPDAQPLPADLADPAASAAGKIDGILDATSSPFSGHAPPSLDVTRRLALLYDLPLQVVEETSLPVLLQAIVERLSASIALAGHSALLLKDRATGHLLLRAHVPRGQPAVSLSLARQAMEQRQGLTWRGGQSGDLTATSSGQQVQAAMYAPLLWKGEALGVLCAANYDTPVAFGTDDLRLMLALAQHGAVAVVHHALQEEVRTSAHLMARLMINFSPKVRERLLERARAGRIRLGGQRSGVTILMSDIRDFTRLTRTMDSDDVIDMLNDYFAAMVDIAFRFDGTVDKFIGDAMLVVFGSPEPDNFQHEKAVRAALAIQEAVDTVGASRHARGLVTCDIGIGIHCGEVLHGFIGSNEQMEFTVIGDPVNRTAHYCDAAGPREILMSPELHQWVWRIVLSEPVNVSIKHEASLPAFRLKGIKHADR